MVSFEVDRARQDAARGYLERAGLADRVDLRLEDATEGLKRLEPPFDLAFVDGPKLSYEEHVERCLALLRPGGLLVVDNALMSGAVAGSGGGWSPRARREPARAQRAPDGRPAADGDRDRGGDGVALAVRR